MMFHEFGENKKFIQNKTECSLETQSRQEILKFWQFLMKNFGMYMKNENCWIEWENVLSFTFFTSFNESKH